MQLCALRAKNYLHLLQNKAYCVEKQHIVYFKAVLVHIKNARYILNAHHVHLKSKLYF